MAASVFFSFHYDRDHWRVQQIRNVGALSGQQELSAQDWEQVKRQGDQAVEAWIERQMSGTSAVVVLVGAETANRSWVRYEIVKAWNDQRPLLGVRINGLRGSDQRTDPPGPNPFDMALPDGGNMANYVPLHEPKGYDSQSVYAEIANSLPTWINSGYRRR